MTSWYSHLDKLKEALDALVVDSKFPLCTVTVVPAPPAVNDTRRLKGKRWQVFLSLAGFDDDNEANYGTGGALTVAHIYVRDGKTAEHGAKIEKNRLAAMICEQLNFFLRDPTQYQVDAPVGRDFKMGRGENIRTRNLSFQGGDVKSPNPSADAMGIAHWVVTWSAAMAAEQMGADVLDDLASIYYKASGDELGGDNPDSGDDEETRVTFP